MILHTLNALPSSSAFHDCLKLARAGDALVLMGDGVYAALQGTTYCDALQATGIELYALAPDALAAGITEPAPGISLIGMDSLVTLTERFSRQQAWY